MRIVHMLCAICVGIVSVIFFSTASGQQIGTYPARAVEIQPGVFICDTEASVLQMIESMSIAMREDGVYTIPEDCGELRPGIKGVVKYLKEYQDDYLRMDVVEYTLFLPSGKGNGKPLGIYYGYGESTIKLNYDPTQPLYLI